MQLEIYQQETQKLSEKRDQSPIKADGDEVCD